MGGSISVVLSFQLEAHLLLQPQGTDTLGDPVVGLLLTLEGTPHSPVPAAGGQVCTAPAVRDPLSPALSSICSTNTGLGLGAAFWKQGELGSEPSLPPPECLLAKVRACSGVPGAGVPGCAEGPTEEQDGSDAASSHK